MSMISNLTKTQRTLLLMLVVFAIPYALSWLLYLNPGWFNLGTRNNGTLISPVIPAQQLALTQMDGQAEQADAKNEKWTLLMFGDGQCDQQCEKTLFTLQQLRRMMGVDMAKIRRVYVLPESASGAALAPYVQKYAGTIVRKTPGETYAFIEQKLGIEAGQLKQQILISDPYGNLVMWYPRDIDPKKIFADIEILFGRVKNV